MIHKQLIRLLALFTIAILPLSHANAITKQWSSNVPSSQTVLDHSPWDKLLKTYIDTQRDNKFAYHSVSATDKASLKQYLSQLESINPLKLNQDEQYAYWVNLYNAKTIDIVLDHYPVSSIRKISLGANIFSKGPWKAKVISINNKKLSLDDIEHKILRPIWKDPRTHYAVNCASVGCPNLANTAYTSTNKEQLLNTGASKFINSKKGVEVKGSTLYLSKIYSWFKADFGESKENILKHLSKYAEGSKVQALNNKDASVKYRYNWSLNGTK